MLNLVTVIVTRSSSGQGQQRERCVITTMFPFEVQSAADPHISEQIPGVHLHAVPVLGHDNLEDTKSKSLFVPPT